MRKKRTPVVSILLCASLLFQIVAQTVAAAQSAIAAPQPSAGAHLDGDRARWLADQSAENLHAADIVEMQEAYEKLAAEYQRLVDEANSGGAGLVGMIASLAAHLVVSALPGAGSVLGPAAFATQHRIDQSARWQDALVRADQETEAEQLHAANIVEVQEAYEKLADEYQRLVDETNSGGCRAGRHGR